MCDALSWGILELDIVKLGLKRGDRIGPLTDDEIIARWGEGADFEDRCGHSALADYYGISDRMFEHEESRSDIPSECVALANRGAYRRVFMASRQWSNVRYRSDGTLESYTTVEPLTIAEVANDAELLKRFSAELRRAVPKRYQKALTVALKQLHKQESEHTQFTEYPWEDYAKHSIGGFVDYLTCYSLHLDLPLRKLNDRVTCLVREAPGFDCVGPLRTVTLYP